jgi:predicted TIM-barrel fold metal-dependent hydrolase
MLQPRRRRYAAAPPWVTEEFFSLVSRNTLVSRCWGIPHWNPLWEAAVELDLPISFHVGSGDMTEGLLKNRVAAYGQAAAFTALAVKILFQNGIQVSDLIMSGVLSRYPSIKFVSVESGIGWIPFMLETMDYQFQGNSVAEERPDFDLLPSEYFARNVYACYWFEQIAPRRLIDKIGEDKILFETDFPHPTSLYGEEGTPGSRVVSTAVKSPSGTRSSGRTRRSSIR